MQGRQGPGVVGWQPEKIPGLAGHCRLKPDHPLETLLFLMLPPDTGTKVLLMRGLGLRRFCLLDPSKEQPNADLLASHVAECGYRPIACPNASCPDNNWAEMTDFTGRGSLTVHQVICWDSCFGTEDVTFCLCKQGGHSASLSAGLKVGRSLMYQPGAT